MDSKKIKELCGELPDLLGRGYHPGELFFNKYSGDEPTRVGCRYCDKAVASGGASEEFIVLVEKSSGVQNFEDYESEKILGGVVFYGYVPDFPPVKRFIEDGECNFLSWKSGKSICTVVNLTREKAAPADLSQLPGLRTYEDSKDDKILKKIFGQVKSANKALRSPFAMYAGYLPPGISGWGLVTIFVFMEVIAHEGKTYLVPRVQGNYRHLKGDEYLNLKLGFELSFFPDNLSPLRPGVGGEKTLVSGREVYKKEASILYYDRTDRYSIEVSGSSKRMKIMNGLMSGAMEELEGYSNIEKTMEFIKEVHDVYGSYGADIAKG